MSHDLSQSGHGSNVHHVSLQTRPKRSLEEDYHDCHQDENFISDEDFSEELGATFVRQGQGRWQTDHHSDTRRQRDTTPLWKNDWRLSEERGQMSQKGWYGYQKD